MFTRCPADATLVPTSKGTRWRCQQVQETKGNHLVCQGHLMPLRSFQATCINWVRRFLRGHTPLLCCRKILRERYLRFSGLVCWLDSRKSVINCFRRHSVHRVHFVSSVFGRCLLCQGKLSCVVNCSKCPCAGDFVKNWRHRFFTIHVKPIPSLAYYRDAGKQQRPTQVLPLTGAKVEVRVGMLLSP